MELGIDIGDLDATILSGYPGSIASAWQQAGRSGRRGERALSVLVALDNPLDQYLMRHPQTFFGKPFESARISPSNPYVLKPQLLCAAYEAPITAEDAELFGADLAAHTQELADEGLLRQEAGRWHLEPDVTYPAENVNIRSTSGSFYTLVEEASGAILETMDESSAFVEMHPGAVYLHQGEPYLVTDLDLESHTAYAVRTDVPYYTQARDLTETRVLNVFKEKAAGTVKAYLGEVSVFTQVVGFRRIAHYSGEVLGEEYVGLPVRSYNTVSLWFDIPPETVARLRFERRDLAGGLHAMEHAAIGVLPLFALCDRNDIGGISTPLHPDTGRPQVFIHDGHPGGVGIAEHGYEVIEDLWRATLDVVSQCPCGSGCPGCIHSPKCGNNNQPLDKQVARELLLETIG
jgi:DEAD/DEAH box helicase domain-containing protein